MRQLTALALTLSLGSLPMALPPSAAAPPATPGPGAVLAMHTRLFDAINHARTDEALEFLADDLHMEREYGQRPCTLFLPAPDGTQRASSGRVQSAQLLGQWIAQSTASAWQARIVGGQDDCTSGELSYAVFEFERTRATTGGQRYRQSFQSTSLVTYAKGGWRLTHWHVSPTGPEVRIEG